VFAIDESVYEPAEDSFLFAENLEIKEEETVLDIGTGCGILGILAAKKASEVLLVDWNPYAIRCATKNAVLNGTYGKIAFIRSDLFTSLRNNATFDVILFNAPYLPSNKEEQSWLGRAWDGGSTGRRAIDRFIPEVPSHLKPNGRVLLMQSNLAGVDATLAAFEENDLRARVVAKLGLPFFETITLIKAET
jgi:release factor glutamine methyltransferase